MATLAPKLPYTHAFSGGAQWGGHQRLPSDPDALDYLSRLAAVEGAVEVGVAMAVENFIKGCKADGIWDAIKASCILCGARTLAGALVPLAGAAPTNNNFVDADYNRETGLVGDGSTKYLDSGRADNADPAGNKHYSIYATTTPNQIPIGLNSAGVPSQTYYFGGSVNFYLRFGTTATVSGGALAGFHAMKRVYSSNVNAICPAGSATFASGEAVQSIAAYVFARNNSGTADLFTTTRLAFYSIGESISDLALLDSRVTALIQRIQLSLSTGLDASGYDDATVAYLLAAYNNGATLA